MEQETAEKVTIFGNMTVTQDEFSLLYRQPHWEKTITCQNLERRNRESENGDRQNVEGSEEI